jgi:hypothetical protein
MYNTQFYEPHAAYARPIFAIAGNHDGKQSPKQEQSAIRHFFLNFCARQSGVSVDNKADARKAMTQPYVYWRLDTPLAYIIALYTNIANGGILDDPHQHGHQAQYEWLVAQLTDLKEKNASQEQRRAVLLALHYPPFSGTTNFTRRGDPTLGPTDAAGAAPLGVVLQRAFAESGLRPDAVFSAHAHLYQRLTYRHAEGWDVPYLVAGSGGHAPVEGMWEACDGSAGTAKSVPFAALLPPGLELPAGDSVSVVAYEDQSFGFLRITLTLDSMTGEFFTVVRGAATLSDAFTLDLRTHRVQTIS